MLRLRPVLAAAGLFSGDFVRGREILPSFDVLQAVPGTVEVRTVAVPADCSDGFLGVLAAA
jgi:hypothetical protein